MQCASCQTNSFPFHFNEKKYQISCKNANVYSVGVFYIRENRNEKNIRGTMGIVVVLFH